MNSLLWDWTRRVGWKGKEMARIEKKKKKIFFFDYFFWYFLGEKEGRKLRKVKKVY